MGKKIRIEICMISARGLPRSSSLWKLQWFAVGWIDPESKYCSRIDGSGGTSAPTWRTKFSVAVDEEKVDLRRLVLSVEVRSREAIFLREKLHGAASIPLREFVERFNREGRRSPGVEEVGSFQLRGRRSGEPRGFVDVSVRIWEEGAGNDAPPLDGDYPHGYDSSLPYSGRNKASLSMEDGTTITYTDASWQQQHEEKPKPQPQPPPPKQPLIRRRVRTSTSTTASSRARPSSNVAPPTNPTTPYPYVQGHSEEPENSYTRRPTPPPPPPPSNTGFLPSFFPSTYTDAPPKSGGFGMGVGAGALAAGAVLFGDDFMSASSFPGSGSLNVSADPPF